MSKKLILKKLDILYNMKEVTEGFSSRDACIEWGNKVAPLLKFNQQYYANFLQNAHKIHLNLSGDSLETAFNIMKSQVRMAIEELKIEIEKEKFNLLEWLIAIWNRLNPRREIVKGIIKIAGITLTGVFGVWVAYINYKAFRPNLSQSINTSSSPGATSIQIAGNYNDYRNAIDDFPASSPSFEEIRESEKEATWNISNGGDHRSYLRLLGFRKTEDATKKELVMSAIERVENSYRTDIMTINIQNFLCICKSNARCPEDGYEPITGFSANNITNHLTPDRHWRERARAACLLRNLKASPDKNEINKEILYERITNSMKDNNLSVSKMAFETYKELTGFTSPGVFDFDKAAAHWEENKDEILKINF